MEPAGLEQAGLGVGRHRQSWHGLVDDALHQLDGFVHLRGDRPLVARLEPERRAAENKGEREEPHARRGREG